MATSATVLCGVCEAPTVTGFMCSRCDDALRTLIIHAGITYTRDNDDVLCILDELDLQLSRQARAGPRLGGRGAETPIPFDSRAAKAHAILSDVLMSWARHYGAVGGALRGPRSSAYWLIANIGEIVMSADSVLIHGDLTRASASALIAIDREEAKTYIGICSGNHGTCTMDLYASGELPILVCPQCGTVHDVEIRRGVMLDTAQELVFNAVDTVRMITTYGGRLTPGQLYKWKFRGRLIARGSNAEGHPMYRLGDVLGLVGRDTLHLPGVEG